MLAAVKVAIVEWQQDPGLQSLSDPELTLTDSVISLLCDLEQAISPFWVSMILSKNWTL